MLSPDLLGLFSGTNVEPLSSMLEEAVNVSHVRGHIHTYGRHRGLQGIGEGPWLGSYY